VHELSHCLVARRLGIPVRQITLFIFGGVSEMDSTHSSGPSAEFRIAIAGPMASIAVGIVTAVPALMADSVEGIVGASLQYIYSINFLLAAFNLVPAFPLDGGRVLRSWLWGRTGNPAQATRTAARVGSIFATILMAVGLFSLLTLHIIPGIWSILLGLFLRKSADAEFQSFEVRFRLQDMKLRQIMTPPVAVETSTSISDFVNEFVFRYHNRVFPVLENSRFAGMVDVRSIKGVPASEWPTTSISGFLSRSDTYCVVGPEANADEVLAQLLSERCHEAAVVQDGILIGVLSRSDIFKIASLKSDLAA
jgi:Zn-dependent protease/predicted transcriptional regulator